MLCRATLRCLQEATLTQYNHSNTDPNLNLKEGRWMNWDDFEELFHLMYESLLELSH